MKSFLVVPLAAMLIAGLDTVMVAQPAMAWDLKWCEEHHDQTGECAHWFPSPAPTTAPTQKPVPPAPKPTALPPTIINNGGQGGKGGNGGSANQNQHQGQHQNQSLNNRLNQSLVNSPTTITNYHQSAQLPMVNAPECGGVNAGVSADLQGSVALSAAVHFGRRPDSCVHHDDAPPTTNVHVDVAAAQPVVQPAAQVITKEVRTVSYVHVHDKAPCRNYPASDIAFWYNDLKLAKQTRNLRRIDADWTHLNAACRGDLIDRAIDP